MLPLLTRQSFRRKPIALTLLASLFLSAGCLERKEHITIAPDGSTTIQATFEGDPAEFQNRDALPTNANGWTITDETSKDSSGNDKLVRTASLSIPAGKPLPATYATSPADAEVALSFPTTLIKEVRPDGTYYHFKRTIKRRDDARFTAVRRMMELDDRQRNLIEDRDSDLTPDERAHLVDMLRTIELDKQLAILDIALEACPDIAQDVALRIRATVRTAGEAFDTNPTIQLMGLPQSEQRDRSIELAAESFTKTLSTSRESAIADSNLSPKQKAALNKAYTIEQRRRMITETLAAHMWETRLSLPGTLIASNADRTDNNELLWEYSAPAIMDTDKVLEASSFIPAPTK